MTDNSAQPAAVAISEQRRARGLAAYARIFGVPDPEVSAVLANRVGPEFTEEALQAAGGAGWWHPALTARDRSIAVLTALVCQGVTGERLRTHIRLGRQQGLDEAALTALMTLLASYAGYPRASLAMETVVETFTSAAPQPSQEEK